MEHVSYITSQWGEFRVNNATLCLHVPFWYFFCFSSKNLCFYHFHFFFWWAIKFPQQSINQLETGIGDKKLSVKLYVNSITDSASSSAFILKTPAYSTSCKMKCFCCGKVPSHGITKKFCVKQRVTAKDMMKTNRFFKDEVYTRISDLDTVEKLLAADL